MMYRRISLSSGDWTLDDVVVADTREIRREGLKIHSVDSLLLWTLSIHTFTMSESIRATTITSTGRVIASRLIPPFRLTLYRSARWVLETSPGIPPPVAGESLIALPFLENDWLKDDWLKDDRKAHDLRNPDREPQRSV